MNHTTLFVSILVALAITGCLKQERLRPVPEKLNRSAARQTQEQKANMAKTEQPANPQVTHKGIQPLTVKGEDFVNATGDKVRLWGVNLVVLFPEHQTAEKTAANLASLGINCVRPHHMLRSSKDWNPSMVSGCLVDYKNDSLTPDPLAWDRYDYLNSCLRKKDIYLMLSIGSSRHYLPGDVKVMDGGEADNKAWQAAVKELNGWHWKKGIDVKKMLPLVDERAARVNEEFAKLLLNHANPYSKQKYGTDPQVLTVEILNEFSLDYVLICGNKFPEYWQKKLVAKWQAFAKEKGVEYCDLYKTRTTAQRKCRGEFFRKLQEDYQKRIERVIRDCGFKGAVAFSNLWRGEAAGKLHWDLAGYVEDHLYSEPRVAESKKDFVLEKSKTRLAGKPYVLGEANYCEWGNKVKEQRRERTTLPLALASYGAFNNWSGVIWFAWNHGGRAVGADGWAKQPSRQAHLGDMIADDMMLDHFRTCAAIFRRGLVKESVDPKMLYVYGDYIPGNYHALVKGKISYKDGWQDIHALKKVFGRPPADDKTRELLQQETPAVLVSDTGQIIKDTEKKHFLVKSPYAQAFAGNLHNGSKAVLDHFSYSETDCSITIIMVSDNEKPIRDSESLIVSRTVLDKSWQDSDKGVLKLSGLKPAKGQKWQATVSRPRANAGQSIELKQNADGTISLPVKGWYECELKRK